MSQGRHWYVLRLHTDCRSSLACRSLARSLAGSVARSLHRSLTRSIARSLDRSLARSIVRSLVRLIARSTARSQRPHAIPCSIRRFSRPAVLRNLYDATVSQRPHIRTFCDTALTFASSRLRTPLFALRGHCPGSFW